MRRLAFLVLIFFLVLGLDSFSCTLYWFTGAGIKKPAKEIAGMFSKSHHCRVVIISGGSGQVLNEMLQAKKGDVYTLVDSNFLKEALRYGIVERYKKIVELTPVFIVSKNAEGRIKSIEDLAKPDVKIAAANPKAVAVGRVFYGIMKRLPDNLRNKIEKNVVVKCLNVLQIVGYVKSGVVDAGIVLDKVLIKDADLNWIDIPENYNIHRYAYVALIKYSSHKNEAKELYDFILKHLDVYKRYGFELVKTN